MYPEAGGCLGISHLLLETNLQLQVGDFITLTYGREKRGEQTR